MTDVNGSVTSPRYGRQTPTAALALAAGALLVAVVCPLSGATGAGPVKVAVSILPQAWFVEQVGGELVTVTVLVGPGHSPATYEPTPRQMAALEEARLFLAAGVPFERGLVPRVRSLPSAPIVTGPEATGHGHDHDHETDPHTWLDPTQARAMSDSISHHLQALDPENAAIIRKRHEELCQQLLELDERIRTILAPFQGRSFLVFHPAFGHFASAYDLVQIPVEAGGHEPGPRHLAEIIDRARASGARSVIVQPQFSRKSAETVAAAIGAEIVVLDPLAADYPANLLEMARTLAYRFAVEDGS